MEASRIPIHKFGKQTELINFQEIQEKVAKVSHKLTREALAFFWLLYYCGVRKSEGYERTVDDAQETQEFFVIDFHQRKKHGATTPPLELPLWFPGVDLLCAQLAHARKKRAIRKLIERSVDGKRVSHYERAQWLFPHVHKEWALQIVKKILGKQYYPHFLRLNRISEICSNPEANIEMIKSFSGIKTIKVIEDNYLGVSKRQQQKAVSWIAKQIKPEQ